MDTNIGERTYDKALDRTWSSEVYQKAKDVIEKVLTQSGNPVPSNQIRQVMKQEYSSLCNDLIKDRNYPKIPYWYHLVATAISALQKQGKVRKTNSGWVWTTGERVPPEPPTQPLPQPPGDQDIRLQLRDRLLKLDPQQFENVVAKLLKALGMEEIIVTGRSADGGIDAEGTIPIINIKVAAQAKRYALQNSVGIDPVQRLIGSVVTGGYDRGIFITTSGFTAGAKETAERPDSRIVLLDGEKLVDIMLEKGLGIREVPIVKEELDEGFFGSITH